jgi:hypothetical protein
MASGIIILTFPMPDPIQQFSPRRHGSAAKISDGKIPCKFHATLASFARNQDSAEFQYCADLCPFPDTRRLTQEILTAMHAKENTAGNTQLVSQVI